MGVVLKVFFVLPLEKSARKSHQTPNPILQTTDVPGRSQRNIRNGVSYPTDLRYTFQWNAPPEDQIILDHIPNNNDATFKDLHENNKPADLLLHYNYGAAAVLHWGRNKSVLEHRPGILRPSVRVAAPREPESEAYDRSIDFKMCNAATSQGEQGATSWKKKRHAAAADSGA